MAVYLLGTVRADTPSIFGEGKGMKKLGAVIRTLSPRVKKVIEDIGHVYECLVTEFRYRGYPLELMERITRGRINALYFTHEFFEEIKRKEPDLFHFVLEGCGHLSEGPVHYAKAQEVIADWSGFLKELEELLPLLRGGDKKIFRETISQLKQSIAVMASVRPERIR